MVQIQKSFSKLAQGGQLYLVPTPIGNLQDITLRALEILKSVALIASEDTRQTQRLLNHFEIKTPQLSFHEHNHQQRIPELLARLQAGEMIAQVSDAGMPSISDPGQELVRACVAAGIPVISLPGATAGVTALIASGLATSQFFFYGFLARKKNDQVKELQSLKQQRSTLLFYESPHRLKSTLTNMAEVFGTERQGVICRELTKIHEEYLRGSLAELVTYLEEHDLKGECCILVAGAGDEANELAESTWSHLSLREHVLELIELTGLSPKESIKEVANLRGLKKQEVYKAYHILNETVS